ncbi:signal peptidase I [Pyrodictium delaneyi]|uniref:Signal peptidase I n=1 Tax=Pyrodictium delaneyi TaxID=1273541 RepID=A0A211YRS5_9CREN|nr:signal peptidase I [Pyrodictium delaneyi]
MVISSYAAVFVFLMLQVYRGIYSYVLPALASIVAIVAALISGGLSRSYGYSREGSLSTILALTFWIALLSGLGLIGGFAINPLAPSIDFAVFNTIFLLPLAAGRAAVASLAVYWKNQRFLSWLAHIGYIISMLSTKFTMSEIELMLSGTRAPLATAMGLLPVAFTAIAIYMLARYASGNHAMVYAIAIDAPAKLLPILPAVAAPIYNMAILLPAILVITILGQGIVLHREKRASKDNGNPYWIATISLLAMFLLIALWMGYWPLMVLTGSMKPTLNPGDIVIVKPTDHVRTGDIIAYRLGDAIVLHRVINKSIDENGKVMITTKGDNNRAPDAPVETSSVLGVKIVRIPYAGLPLLHLARLLGGSIQSAQLFIAMLVSLMLIRPSIPQLVKKKVK